MTLHVIWKPSVVSMPSPASAKYWLVNPINATIVVFALPEGEQRYEIHGVYLSDTIAESVLLPGFKVDVTACFKEAEL